MPGSGQLELTGRLGDVMQEIGAIGGSILYPRAR